MALINKTPPLKKCKVCSEEFKQYNSLQSCCSWSCSNIYNKEKENEKNIEYKQIQKTSTQLAELIYNKNRKEIIKEQFEELGYNKCMLCPSTYILETHHIVWRSEKPLHVHLHNKANLILLCKKCHDNHHENKDLRKSLLKARNLIKLFNIN